MIVTSVTPLDKRRNKIVLDEEETIVLYKGEMKRYQIKEEEELSEDIYQEIIDEILCKRARERVLYLLKASDKTEQELRRKLKEGFYPQKAIDKAIEFTKKYHYVDDQSYGERYIESCGKRKSKNCIEFDLIRKGLDREAVRELLDAAEIDEESQIVKFLQKKHYDPSSAERQDKAKLKMALARKGFSFETITRVMGTEEYFD